LRVARRSFGQYSKQCKGLSMSSIVLIGYSGHAYVVADILFRQGSAILGYMEHTSKENDPFNLSYLGDERDAGAPGILNRNSFLVAIGDNSLRKKVYEYLVSKSFTSASAIHPAALIASGVSLGQGLTVMAGAVISPLAAIGTGVIINTGAIVEHECKIGDFVHVAPGAVLAGNVNIGNSSFIGANSTVKEGITIGKNVIVGAGSVILKDVPDNSVIYGNPGRIKK
jgi:sugar O-acyltransferase (sialic acid O-acetyltransferase NeuD family)